MFNNLPVGRKLELLVFIPLIAFFIVLFQYGSSRISEWRDIQSVDARYHFFVEVQVLLDELQESLIAVVGRHEHASLDLSVNQKIDALKNQLQILGLAESEINLQLGELRGLADELPEVKAFNLENPDDAEAYTEAAYESVTLLNEQSNLLLQSLVRLPVNVDDQKIRHNNSMYLLLKRLRELVQQEYRHYALYQSLGYDVDVDAVQDNINRQQLLIDTYLNIYANPSQVNTFLEVFSSQAFSKANDIRSDLLMNEGFVDGLTTEDLNNLAERSQQMDALIKPVAQEIDTELARLVAQAEQSLMINVLLLLFVLAVVSFFAIKISKRIKGSLKFIGDSLETIEHEKNYGLDVSIAGQDEFSKLAEKLGVLIQERAISEFEMIAAKEEAEQANKAKSAFLANMSHEIRTPLNGIIGMANILEKSKLERQQKEHLQTIRSSSKILLNLINDVLDISKIESDSLNVAPTDADIFAVVSDVIAIIAPKAKSNHVNLEVDFDPSVPYLLFLDDHRVQQILLNLMSNAIKFAANANVIMTIGCTEVKASDDGKKRVELSVAVADTGIGIAEEKLDAVFQPFKQADDSITRKFQGTGLGLAISKRLAELMGGTIELESVLNEGSTFTFRVPSIVVQVDNDELPKFHQERIGLYSKDDDGLALTRRDLSYFGAQTFDMSGDVDGENKGEGADIANDKPLPWAIYQMAHQENLDDALGQIELLKSQPENILLLHLPEHDLSSESLENSPVKEMYPLPIRGLKLAKLMAELISGDHGDDAEEEIKDRGIKVLLVEDDPTNQTVAELCLVDEGFDVEIADDGLEGLNMFKDGDYDLILMDCMMPVMDGLTSTKEIRAYEKEHKLKHIPIVALTASVLNDDIQNCFKSGMDAYLHKPFEIKSLVKQIVKGVEEFPMH